VPNDFLNSGEAINKLLGKKTEIEKLLEKGMEKALLIIDRDAKIECTDSVDEGRLRASLGYDIESNEDEVRGRYGTNLDYAPYIHQGTGIYAIDGNGRKTPWFWEGDSVKWEGKHLTRGQKPNPFIQKAIDKNRDKISEIFKETMEGLK
jgi:HK97 gp10 family phage protein